MRIRFDKDQWEEIFDSLSKNKARTFLTAFGIFWGIFMLVLLMGGGKGLESMLDENFSGFASNSGFIISSNTSKPYKGFRRDRYWKIDLNDLPRLRRAVPQLDIITPTLRTWGIQAVADNRSCNVSMCGIREDYNRVDNPKVRKGRCLSAMDDAQVRKVCVVGSRVVEELFPKLGKEGDPTGRFIQVDGVYYRIVGVSGKGSSGMSVGGNPTTTIYIPYNTMQSVYHRGRDVDFLCITAHENYRMSDVQREAEKLLKRIHLIHPDDTQAVFKINAESMFGMVDSLFQGVSILVWMIGLGTLLAGAVGVSNIMIITVRERTTEIGIRRAIGATPTDILTMVLSESVVLTLLAGMSGITVAVAILQVMEEQIHSQFQISFYLAVGAALLLTMLGIVAGLLPAIRAMQIKPVDAMREE